jgi:RecA-family ATPase
MNLAITAAAGGSWLGYKAARDAKVLYVNFELFEASFRKRVNWIARALGLDMEKVSNNFHSLCLRDEPLAPE